MVKRLDAQLDFDQNMAVVNGICDRKRSLPEQVFKQSKGCCISLLFDEIFLPTFFADMKEFLRLEKETDFFLIVLDPDPETYFLEHFNTYHLALLSKDDKVEDYMDLLNQDPGGSPADAIIHSSNILLFYSVTTHWAIYADRNWEIAICWFSNKEVLKNFRHVYSGVVLDTAEDTLEFIKETLGDRPLPIVFEDTFRENYFRD